jgi:hypothetical protein
MGGSEITYVQWCVLVYATTQEYASAQVCCEGTDVSAGLCHKCGMDFLGKERVKNETRNRGGGVLGLPEVLVAAHGTPSTFVIAAK